MYLPISRPQEGDASVVEMSVIVYQRRSLSLN